MYTDLVYRAEGETLTTDLSFIVFVTSIAPRVGEVVLFGRLDPKPGRSHYELPREGVRLVPLPHYPRVTSIGPLLRSVRRARAAFSAELDRLDAVWLFGPHPLALEFARIARRRGKTVFLGIRQDFPKYIAGRLPSRGWLWAVPVAHALEQAFRRLSRTAPTVVVGEDLGRRYRRHGGRVLSTGFSLVRDSDLVPVEQALARLWDGPELRLLTVGRLESEKNPLLLPEILAELRRRDERWRLRAVGDGPMAVDVERRARELGVSATLELPGYVALPALWQEYRSSHAFLHVSLTEGLPQVLFEAQAAGLPVVATDVGGVRAGLGDGASGLVVPPRDAQAAAAAVDRLRAEEPLRRRLVEASLANAARETMDAQLDRVAAFFRESS